MAERGAGFLCMRHHADGPVTKEEARSKTEMPVKKHETSGLKRVKSWLGGLGEEMLRRLTFFACFISKPVSNLAHTHTRQDSSRKQTRTVKVYLSVCNVFIFSG